MRRPKNSVTSALMLAGIEFMVEHYADYPPGIQLLPAEVEHRIAELATRSHLQFGS